MPVETRHMEHTLATIVDEHNALFNDSAIAHIENSLGGIEFALVGVSSHMKTMDLEWLILFCGGTLTKYITDSTKYVIKGTRVGDTMHPHADGVEGMQLYKDALDRGVTILSTLEFFQLLEKHNPDLSIKNLVDGWSKHITFSLRDTSAYGTTNRHLHKYSLEIAKSDRSRCHGHCRNIIPKGEIRLKACFDPLTDSFVYFRCLKCITPSILDHIVKEWKKEAGEKHADPLLQFVLAQPDSILSMFRLSETQLPTELLPTDRLQCAENLVQYLLKCAGMERHEERHHLSKAANKMAGDIPIANEGQLQLGKRKRTAAFSSPEIMDFMHGIPANVVQKTTVEQHHGLATRLVSEMM